MGRHLSVLRHRVSFVFESVLDEKAKVTAIETDCSRITIAETMFGFVQFKVSQPLEMKVIRLIWSTVTVRIPETLFDACRVRFDFWWCEPIGDMLFGEPALAQVAQYHNEHKLDNGNKEIWNIPSKRKKSRERQDITVLRE